MIVEVILPQYCLEVGSKGNLDIIQKVFDQVEVIYCPYDQPPQFPQGQVDLVYMGSYDDYHQKIIFSHFSRYATEWKQAIERGQAIFMTGNAWDFLGESIRKENGEEREGLGIFNFKVQEDFRIRHNFFSIGQRSNDLKVGGLVAEFTRKEVTGDLPYFMEMIRGEGFNAYSAYNGLLENNCLALNYYGPVLSYNIDLIHFLAELTGCSLQQGEVFHLIEENTTFIHQRFLDPTIRSLSAI